MGDSHFTFFRIFAFISSMANIADIWNNMLYPTRENNNFSNDERFHRGVDVTEPGDALIPYWRQVRENRTFLATDEARSKARLAVTLSCGLV